MLMHKKAILFNCVKFSAKFSIKNLIGGLYQSSLSIVRVLEVVKMKCAYNEKELWPYMMQVIKKLGPFIKETNIFLTFQKARL